MTGLDEVLSEITKRAASRDADGPPATGSKSPTPPESGPSQKEPQNVSTKPESLGGQDPNPAEADVAILTALSSPELDQVLRTFSPRWRPQMREGVIFNVGDVEVDGQRMTVVAAVQNAMGMVPAAILATKTIRAWRPRVIAMAGVCAGVEGKVNLGDVVVARQIFDYGSGKLAGGRLQPDYEPIPMDDLLSNCAINLQRQKPALAALKDGCDIDGSRPTSELRVHVGSMASGAAVVADESIVDGIQEHKRSLIAIDMESYGFALAAFSALPRVPFIIAKGVQDFATLSKADDFREYAAFVSAQYLQLFFKTFWASISAPRVDRA